MANIGGQAVIEGVMMKSPDYIVTAVRKPNGNIVHKKYPVKTLTTKKFFKLPFIRGVVSLFETLVIGIKALNYSANEAVEDEDNSKEKLSTISIIGTIAISLGFALIIFKLIPLGFAQLLNNQFKLFENRYLFNLVEGLTKILILIGYIYTISKFKDIQRVFQYHGAEHKAVNCYEKENKVNLELAKEYSTIHRRCGTSFILFVLTISIVVYLFLPIDISFLSKSLLRISLLPIIAGISYEALKLSAKYEDNKLINLLVSPGLMLQKITTSEPDDEQLEVAIYSLNKSIEKEKN
jgi:uncharacterized protein YqhQ